MEIKFKKKELDTDWPEVSRLDYCYILAIKEQYPRIWRRLKIFINHINDEGFLRQEDIIK